MNAIGQNHTTRENDGNESGIGLDVWLPEFETLCPEDRMDRADLNGPYYWNRPVPSLARERDDRLFHVRPSDDSPLKTVVCERCGGTEFNVGVGLYYAAIRCPRCKWERGVRDR
jgi:hypothetical protein